MTVYAVYYICRYLILRVISNTMDEKSATKYAAGFFAGVLENLHVAVCKEAIARKIDLSVDQVELIREISQKAVDHAREHTNTRSTPRR